MPSKKANKIVDNEVELLKKQIEELNVQNKAFAIALTNAVESADLDVQMSNTNLKALLIRLGGSVFIDHVTMKAANKEGLNIMQEYHENGGCKYTLVMKGTDEK